MHTTHWELFCGFHMWMERESKAFEGCRPQIRTCWDQKPDLLYTFVQLLLKKWTWPQPTLRPGVYSNVMTGWTLAHCPTVPGWKRESGQETRRSDTRYKEGEKRSTPEKPEVQQVYPPPVPGQDRRSRDELETAGAFQKEETGHRTESQTLRVEI